MKFCRPKFGMKSRTGSGSTGALAVLAAVEMRAVPAVIDTGFTHQKIRGFGGTGRALVEIYEKP